MAATQELRGTENYAVETPAGQIGRVEEVRPNGLAVRTHDGGYAFLLERDILTVDREYHWVVVEEHPALFGVDTGTVVHPEPVVRGVRLRAFFQRHAPHIADRPLWQLVAILYGALTAIVGGGVGLVFLIAWLTTGAPY